MLLCVYVIHSLLRQRLGAEAVLDCHDYQMPFKLGDVQVSFHSAGHILGSSQVRLEYDNDVWVAAGDYKRAIDPTCEPFEVVPCDTFITEATFGLPIYQWDKGSDVAEEIATWWESNRETGKASILFCYAWESQRILAELAKLTTHTVYIHGALENLIQCYRDAG